MKAELGRYRMKESLLRTLVYNRPSEMEEEIRKKPVLLEAMQLTGSGPHDIEVYQWIENHVGGFGPVELQGEQKGVSVDPRTGFMLLATPDGVKEAEPGDWIIRGIRGDFHPIKPDVFKATYDPA